MKNKALVPIFLIVLVDILGMTLILPLLPFYAEKFGASPFQVGLLVTSFALCQFLAGPVLGELSDRFGRRPVLLLSQLGTFIGFLILGFSGALWVVFLSRIIDGITAGNLTVAQAYISDNTEPKDRARAFGLIGISFGLGFLVGPGVSGYLTTFGIQAPIFAAAGLSFLSIMATTFLLPRIPRAEGGTPFSLVKAFRSLHPASYAGYLARPELGRFLIKFFLFSFAFSLWTSGFALFSERRFLWEGHAFGAREVGYYMSYLGFLGIFIQGGLMGWLVKKWGERRVVFVGFAAMAVGYCLIGFADEVKFLFAAGTISAFGTGVLRPSLTSLVSQSAGRQEQGAVIGVSQGLGSIAQVIAPMIGGYLIEQSHLSGWAWLAAVVAACGLLL